jgi:hypothetical protein
LLTGISTGKRPLGRPRRRWEDFIRIDIKEIGINTRNWIDSAQVRDNGEPFECGIERFGPINHGVGKLTNVTVNASIIENIGGFSKLLTGKSTGK